MLCLVSIEIQNKKKRETIPNVQEGLSWDEREHSRTGCVPLRKYNKWSERTRENELNHKFPFPSINSLLLSSYEQQQTNTGLIQ